MTFEHRVSGYDFVRAMLFAGYRLVGSTMWHSVLRRGASDLLVPQDPALGEATILRLLEEARITPLHFVTLVNRLSSRDTWPEQEELRNESGEWKTG